MAYQGTHTLQAICAFVPTPEPLAVLAQVAGAEGLRPNAHRHYAPDDCIAEITFADDSRALLRVGIGARHVLDAADVGTKWMHKRVAAYGTAGFIEWTMWSWKAHVDGGLDGGRHDYWAEDLLGQAGLTDSMAEWIDSGAENHPLSLRHALNQFNVVLGAYTSALDRKSVDLPVAPRPGLIEELRVALGAS
jgi:predicted dehydrogenase